MTSSPASKSNNIPVYLNDLGIVCSLGSNKQEIISKLFYGSAENNSSKSHTANSHTANSHTTNRNDESHSYSSVSGLTFTNAFTSQQSLPLGQVNADLPSVEHLPIVQQTRSNQLLLAALQQIETPLKKTLSTVNPLRVGVVLGASTSGILEGEQAIAKKLANGEWPNNYCYQQQEMSSPAESLADWLGVSGPVMTISTACSSGAKALASARRMLRTGVCDLVIAGGVDALCQLTVNGFGALESVSDQPCVPFSRNRNGINIGEGAALFVMTRTSGAVELKGVGETSDAHHISAPAPDGRGAIDAINFALADGSIKESSIDYANLHGTATQQNDKMESTAIHQVFGASLPCSSTKGFTGHTLGAAGAIEAGFCWLSIMQREKEYCVTQSSQSSQENFYLPLHQWDGEYDETLDEIDLVSTPRAVDSVEHTISNSFAFGGNNICLLISKAN